MPVILAACSGASPHAAERPYATLIIAGPPAGAIAFIEDQPAWYFDDAPAVVHVDPGRRRLRVEAPNHLVHRDEFELTGGQIYDLRVELWPCFVGIDDGCVPAASPDDAVVDPAIP